VVEQGTHKPLVGSSTLPPGTLEPLRDTVHYGSGTAWKILGNVVHLAGKKHTSPLAGSLGQSSSDDEHI
jgi:hypothetical protein